MATKGKSAGYKQGVKEAKSGKSGTKKHEKGESKTFKSQEMMGSKAMKSKSKGKC